MKEIMNNSEVERLVMEVIKDILMAIRRIQYKKVEEFCANNDISKSTVTKLESGALLPSKKNLQLYSNALGIKYTTVAKFAIKYIADVGTNRKGPVQEVFDFLMQLSDTDERIVAK